MRASSLFLFVFFALAAIGLATARYLGLDAAMLDRFDRMGELVALLLPYVLIFAGVLVASLVPRDDGSTFWTALGTFAGLSAAIVAILSLLNEHKRSTDAATLQLIVDLDKSRPQNSRFCRCALLSLLEASDEKPLRDLTAREQVTLDRQVSPLVDRCLSDVAEAERKELVRGETEIVLTRRGAAYFADRVNRIMSLDDDVAFAVNTRLVRRELVTLSLLQNMAVSKSVADAYHARFGVVGYPNIGEMRYVDASKTACKSRDAMSTSQ